jgi:hypothetical protein
MVFFVACFCIFFWRNALLVGLAIDLGLIDNPFPDNVFLLLLFLHFFLTKCSFFFVFPFCLCSLFFPPLLAFLQGGHELTLYKIRLT